MSGYKVIDFKNVNIELNVSNVVEGVYEAITTAKKPTLLNRLIVAGVELAPVFCNFVSTAECVATVLVGANTYKITISSDDHVTIIPKN